MAKKFRAGSLYGRTGVFYNAVGVGAEAPASGLMVSGVINCSEQILSSGQRVLVGDSSDENPVFKIRVLQQGEYDNLISITGVDANTLYFIKP